MEDMMDSTFDSGKTFDKTGKMIRNRLNLAQRIEVIKEYQRNPDLGYLAERFHCGRRQIKHILGKRSQYLTEWNREMKRTGKERVMSPSQFMPVVQRKSSRDSSAALKVIQPVMERKTGDSSSSQSVAAVETILNEWMQRAKCYCINITDDILINFAQEIAEHIDAKTFNADNHVWLAAFKKKYDFGNLIFVKQEPGLAVRKPLSISLIIQDLQKEQGFKLPVAEPEESQEFDYSDDDGLAALSNVEIQIDDYAVHSPDSTMQIDGCQNGAKSEDGSVEYAQEIDTYKNALNQLGPLEQFALLKENVRAVGLINQLENIFRDEMAKSGFK